MLITLSGLLLNTIWHRGEDGRKVQRRKNLIARSCTLTGKHKRTTQSHHIVGNEKEQNTTPLFLSFLPFSKRLENFWFVLLRGWNNSISICRDQTGKEEEGTWPTMDSVTKDESQRLFSPLRSLLLENTSVSFTDSIRLTRLGRFSVGKKNKNDPAKKRKRWNGK